jgi:hypothetical protein
VLVLHCAAAKKKSNKIKPNIQLDELNLTAGCTCIKPGMQPYSLQQSCLWAAELATGHISAQHIALKIHR